MFHKRGKQQELSEKEAKRVNEKFNSFKNKQYSEDDMNKVFDNEENILKKMNNKYLNDFIEDIKLYFLMLKDFFTKKYTKVPVGTIVAIAATLLYVLAPLDLIPDFMPFVGYLDDAGIDLAATQFSALKEIPRLEELVKLFIQNFWKRIALFVGLMAFYTITVYWIIKPIVLFYINSN